MNLSQFLDQSEFEVFLESHKDADYSNSKWQSLITDWLESKNKPTVESVSMHDLLNSFRKMAGLQIKEAEPVAPAEVEQLPTEDASTIEPPEQKEQPGLTDWVKVEEAGSLYIQGKMKGELDGQEQVITFNDVLKIAHGYTDVRIVSKETSMGYAAPKDVN